MSSRGFNWTVIGRENADMRRKRQELDIAKAQHRALYLAKVLKLRAECDVLKRSRLRQPLSVADQRAIAEWVQSGLHPLKGTLWGL